MKRYEKYLINIIAVASFTLATVIAIAIIIGLKLITIFH